MDSLLSATTCDRVEIPTSLQQKNEQLLEDVEPFYTVKMLNATEPTLLYTTTSQLKATYVAALGQQKI